MQAVYDAKSEEIGPGIYRFKAEIGTDVIPFLETDELSLHIHVAPL